MTAKRRFQGFEITHDEEGFHWENGGPFDTVEECEDDINFWNAQERAAHPEDEPEDTPCLEEPWWRFP